MGKTIDSRELSILLVDDDVVDVMAFKRAVKNTLESPYSIVVANDGVDALDILKSNKILKPFIIILDINMPKMNGIEFLRSLRGDEIYKDSIVFMFTTSTQEVDKKNAYAYNVAGYIAKADYKDSLKKVITLIETYCSIIYLP